MLFRSEEMRKSVKTLNIFTYYRSKYMLLSQLEEIQTYVNRMEAGLELGSDLTKLYAKRKYLLAEIKELKEERNKLNPKEIKENNE